MPSPYDYSPELREPRSMGADFEHPLVRFALKAMGKAMRGKAFEWTPPDGVQVRDIDFTAQDGARIRARLVSPAGSPSKLPGVLSCHGGGFMMPLQTTMLEVAAYLAREARCRIVLPDYRTALEHPFPTSLRDCYDALVQAIERADELGIDAGHMAVYGDSAGGCLAAGVAQVARDLGGPALCGQMLVYPVTDDSQEWPSMSRYADAVWPADANASMWRAYLPEDFGPQTDLAAYARPLRNPDLSKLPRAYVEPAGCDTLRDQGVAYGDALAAAGVPAQVSVTPRAFHAFDEQMDSPLVRRRLAERAAVLRSFFEVGER